MNLGAGEVPGKYTMNLSRTSWNSGAEYLCCEQDGLWHVYYIDNYKMGRDDFSVHQVDRFQPSSRDRRRGILQRTQCTDLSIPVSIFAELRAYAS